MARAPLGCCQVLKKLAQIRTAETIGECAIHEQNFEIVQRCAGLGITQAKYPTKAHYDPSSASAVSTRARMGVLPSWERMRLASVRCWTARARFLLPL
jgi:hypothetical protein